MSSIARARCPECGEQDNVFIIDEKKGVKYSRRFHRAWMECQECEHVFFATDWDAPTDYEKTGEE